MKTIEEKAKAYDEAINRMKHYVVDKYGCSRIKVADVFPELAESEDEKIRKELISFVRGVLACHDKPNAERDEKYESWIAWLEKQGEQKHTAEEVLIKAGLKPYKDGDQWCVLLGDNIQEGICGFGNTIEDALYAFLKDLIASQCEQKSVIKMKTPEESLGIDSDTYNKIVDECVYGEQKPAWSEEDEAKLKSILFHIEDVENKDVINWLKSLKDRVLPQPKQEWDEEDETALGDVLWCCKQAASIAKDENDMGNVWYAERWLKSLRPQSHWKPNDDEMKALADALSLAKNCGEESAFDLRTLYEQLKKLKE